MQTTKSNAPSRASVPESAHFVEHDDAQSRQRFMFLTAARVTVCTVIFGGTVATYLAEGASLDGPTPRLLLAVIVVIYVLSLGYALQIRRAHRARLLQLTQVSIGLDLLAWTALAYVTGGASSPLSTLFGLSTLAAALLLGGNAALWTAVVSLGLYGVLAMAMALGILQPPSDQHSEVSAIDTAYQMVVTLTVVTSITALGGSLADRLVLTGDALVRVEASRANLVALYEDVLRSIPVGLITCDATGRVDGVNPFAASLLETEVSDLLGRSVTELMPFLPAASFDEDALGDAGDARLKTASSEISVGFHIGPLFDRAGKRRGAMVVLDDRSREEDLRGAVEAAERFAVLGRLAAGLAHEIRNPLGAISGCVELVRETAKLDGEDRSLLETVSRDVARLNDLVTDMLQFARPRSPDRQPHDLVELARDVVVLARSSGGPESKAEVSLTGVSSLEAEVDSAQFKQVLWNLLRNAAQVSRPGSGVEVELAPRDHEVAVLVKDRGPGIADELRERIFEAFYSGTARGTGLGLAIVKRIADGHDGRVEIYSRDGGGSVFAFILPRRVKPSAPPEGRPRHESRSMRPGPVM